jgi:hypothetical protein
MSVTRRFAQTLANGTAHRARLRPHVGTRIETAARGGRGSRDPCIHGGK